MSRPKSIAICAASTAVRVALGDTSGYAGGAELQLGLLSQLLRDRGWQVSLVVPSAGDDVPDGEREGIRIIPAYPENRPKGVRGYLTRTVPAYLRALREADASVYLHRGASGLCGWTGLYCRMTDRMTALALAAEADITLYREGNQKRLPVIHNCLYQYYLRHCSVVFAQTPNQMRLLQESQSRGSVLAPNIAEIPDQLLARSVEPMVAWAGSIRTAKRPLWVLDVARQLPHVRFRVAGGTSPRSPELHAALIEQARKVPNVELLGWIGVSQVEELIGQAWALLCTSEMEGFPNVYLMAWARETPVVTSFGAGGLVEASGAGMVGSTPEQLAALIGTLMSDGAQRTQFGQAGRAYVQARHGREMVGNIYDEALTGLLERRA